MLWPRISLNEEFASGTGRPDAVFHLHFTLNHIHKTCNYEVNLIL